MKISISELYKKNNFTRFILEVTVGRRDTRRQAHVVMKISKNEKKKLVMKISMIVGPLFSCDKSEQHLLFVYK